MHHSFLTTALFIASNALVQAQTPTLTPQSTAGGSNPNPATPVATDNPDWTTITGDTLCANSFMPVSELELAELAQSEAPGANNSTAADLSKLSDVPTAAFCKNDGTKITAACLLDSCSTKFPIAYECAVFTPNSTGEGGTKGTEVKPSVDCSETYNFNSTDTISPILCSNAKELYSCARSNDARRTCKKCFTPKDDQKNTNKPDPNQGTATPSTTNPTINPTTTNPTTTNPTTTNPTTTNLTTNPTVPPATTNP